MGRPAGIREGRVEQTSSLELGGRGRTGGLDFWNSILIVGPGIDAAGLQMGQAISE